MTDIEILKEGIRIIWKEKALKSIRAGLILSADDELDIIINAIAAEYILVRKADIPSGLGEAVNNRDWDSVSGYGYLRKLVIAAKLLVQGGE